MPWGCEIIASSLRCWAASWLIIDAASIAVDTWLLMLRWPWRLGTAELCLGIHLAYALAFAWYLFPIVRLHGMFVSRNELANEWKDDLYTVVQDVETGEMTWVVDLETDECNDRFDTFMYDSSHHPWDKGILQNCFSLWCTPRWPADQLGELTGPPPQLCNLGPLLISTVRGSVRSVVFPESMVFRVSGAMTEHLAGRDGRSK